MADIFVSYAADDRERVGRLVGVLERHGWSVWWDRRVTVGHHFDRDIETALDQARCVLVVWSARSIESDWVRTEANEGLERGVLVPVAIDDVRPPLAFRRVQTLPLTNFDAAAEAALIEAIANVLPAPEPTVSPGPQSATPSPAGIRSRPNVLHLAWECVGDAPLQTFTRRIDDELRALNAACARFTVIETGDVPLEAVSSTRLAALGRTHDADYVIAGVVEQHGDERVLTIRVSGTASQQLYQATARAPTQLTFDAQRELTAGLWSFAAERIQDDLRRQLSAVPLEDRDLWGVAISFDLDALRRLIALDGAVRNNAQVLALRARIRAMGVFLGWDRRIATVDAVKADVDRALRLAPHEPQVLSNCAYAMSVTGDPEQGLALAEEAATRFYPAGRDTGFALVRLGRAEEALALEHPNQWGLPIPAQAWAALAERYVAAGRYQEAVDIARRGLRRGGNLELGMWCHLANSLGHLGRIDEAREAWQGAKALEPRANVRGWTRSWTVQFKDPEHARPLYEGLIKAGLE